jgi:DNA polymerase-3 subunit epsilon
MTTLYFDTETTGKADFRLPATSPTQPNLVSIAAILADEQGSDLAVLHARIRPAGFEVPAAAAAIHGITTEDAARHGVRLQAALALFADLVEDADEIVAFNAEFDGLVVDHARYAASRRCDPFASYFEDKRISCAMAAMTPVCRLAKPSGWSGRGDDQWKWPNLQEAHRHCYGVEFMGAHDALADVRATKAVWTWYRQHLGKAAGEAAAA